MGTVAVVIAALCVGVVFIMMLAFMVRSNLRRRVELRTRPPEGLVLPGPARVEWVSEPPDENLLHLFTGGPFDAAHRGRNVRGRRIRQVVRTQYRGYQAVAFTYTCEKVIWVRSPGTSPTQQYTIVSLYLPATRPTLEVFPTGNSSANSFALGYPPFDRKFQVATDDPEFARAVLPQATVQWLLGDPRGRYFPVRFEGAILSTWTSHDVPMRLPRSGVAALRLDRINPMVDYLAEFAGRVPAQAWH